MNALQAVRSRDVEALMAAFDDLEEAKGFRTEQLPLLSPDDCRWFWLQVMDPKQLELTMGYVRTVCLRVAKELDLVPNVHYSLGTLEGLPSLVCSEQVSRVFYARLPPERHSVLRFYLQITAE